MANELLKRAIVDIVRSKPEGVRAGGLAAYIDEALHELMDEGVVSLEGDQADIVTLKRSHHRKLWKHWLEPFGWDYSAILNAWDRQVRAMSDNHLAKLEHATTMPSGTNCWWATYRATEVLRRLIQEEKWRRANASRVSPRTS